MTRQQFLLLKLAEECAEVAQRAIKQIQFGKDERQKDHAPHGASAESKSNQERLHDELMDLVAVANLLQDELEIPTWTIQELATLKIAKKQKMQKYLELSASLSQLPPITL